jgi:hypothetical protein
VTGRETLTDAERRQVGNHAKQYDVLAKALRIIDAQAARIAELEAHQKHVLALATERVKRANARAEEAERLLEEQTRYTIGAQRQRAEAESEAASLRATLDRVRALKTKAFDGRSVFVRRDDLEEALDGPDPSGQSPIPEPERPEQPEHE